MLTQVYSREFNSCEPALNNIPDYPFGMVQAAGVYLDGKIIICGGANLYKEDLSFSKYTYSIIALQIYK